MSHPRLVDDGIPRRSRTERATSTSGSGSRTANRTASVSGAALGRVQRRPVVVRDRGVENLDALRRVGLEAPAQRADGAADVALDDLLARAVSLDATTVQPHRPAADLGDRPEVVAHEDDRPALTTELRHLPEALANRASPTASTSSTITISASTCAATANASRRYIPHEYRLIGVSRNRSRPGELDDLVVAPADVLPRHAEDRGVEVDVLVPRQLGMEARADVEERPRTACARRRVSAR